MRKRFGFLILSLLLSLSSFGVVRGEDYIVTVFNGNIEEKDDNVYIIDFGESLKLAKIVKGVETFESLPVGPCNVFESAFLWEIQRLYKWGIGEAICEIREDNNNKYLHLEVYSTHSSGVGRVEIASWWSTSKPYKIYSDPLQHFEFDVSWQQSSFYWGENAFPVLLRFGHGLLDYVFAGWKNSIGHKKLDLEIDERYGCTGFSILLAFPLPPDLVAPWRGRLDIDNIAVTYDDPPGSGNLVLTEHDFGHQVQLRSLSIDADLPGDSSIEINLYKKETDANDWGMVGTYIFSNNNNISFPEGVVAKEVKYGLSGTKGIKLIASDAYSIPVLHSLTLSSDVVNQLPVASFTYSPANPIAGEEITFDASSSYDSYGTIVRYKWDFGDGNTAAGEVLTYTYAEPNEYIATLTVTNNYGSNSSIQQKIRVYGRTHVLSVGVRHDSEPWSHRGDVGAEHVCQAFKSLVSVKSADKSKLGTDSTTNSAAIVTALNGVKERLSTGDTFVFYINCHGIYDRPSETWFEGDEPNVTLWNGEDSTGDERFYLSHSSSSDRMSDDYFSSLFVDPVWDSVHKLFVIDTCYAGGFWGQIGGLDSGDLARLPRTAILAASPETHRSYARPDSDGYRWGVLGQAVDKALGSFEAGSSISFADLAKAVDVEGARFAGTTGYIQSFEDEWEIPADIEWQLVAETTPDFSLDLRTSEPIVADLNNDRDVDFVDYSVFASHWIAQNCREPNWCNGADLDKSDEIDFIDLKILAEHWLEGAGP